MSLFQRLTRTLRPASANPASILRTARSSHAPRLDSNFFNNGSRVGLGRPTLGRRFMHSYFQNHYDSNMKIIYGIIGLNCAIFGYAQWLKEQARQGYPQGFISHVRNFSLSMGVFFKEGRYYTMLTSVFSHLDLMHLVGNMVSFYYMASLLAATPYFTPVRLLTVIFGAGVSGGLGFLTTQYRAVKERRGNGWQPALGFSGAVMGVGSVAAFLYPKTTFMIYGIVPVPLWVLMGGYALYDGFLVNNTTTGTAHSGHIGGLIFGLGYALLRLRGIRT